MDWVKLGWKRIFIIPCFLGFAVALFGQSSLETDPSKGGLNWEFSSKKVAVSTGIPALPEPEPFHILIDPGHGGKDDGATGQWGLVEKNLALKLSYFILADLQKQIKLFRLNSEVRLSRNNNTFLSLTERVEMANAWGADCFVSIHFNSSTLKTAKGYEIYFLSNEASDEEVKGLVRIENQIKKPLKSEVLNILSDVQNNRHIVGSSVLAEMVYQTLYSKFPNRSRRGIRQGPFTVLVGTDMPAILVEAGYITNPEEAERLANPDYLKSIANAISSGIMDFIIQHKRV